MCRNLIPVGWMVTGLAASLLLAAIVACGCGSDDTRDDARYSSRAKKEKKADRGPPPSELERAAEGLPRDPTVRFHLAVVLYERGKKKEALANFEKALRINPNFTEAQQANDYIRKIKEQSEE